MGSRAALVAAVVVAGSIGGTSSASPSPSVRSALVAPVAGPAEPPAAPLAAVRRVALVRSVPVRVRIASIGLDSRLMALGLEADGTLQVPPAGFPAGWYTGGPTRGSWGRQSSSATSTGTDPGSSTRCTGSAWAISWP